MRFSQLIVVLLLHFLQVFSNNHCVERIYNNNVLTKSTRFDVGICRSYRSMENLDRSYMDECSETGDTIITKRFEKLKCQGDYDIVQRVESNTIDDSDVLRINHQVGCSDTSGNVKHNRLLYYDVADCDNPSIDDAHCVGTLVSSHKFCNVDFEESWKAKCQNNIYEVVFYDKPDLIDADESDYCKNTLKRNDDTLSANFGSTGEVCVGRDTQIFQILFGENFQGADNIYLKLKCQDDATNNNRKTVISSSDRANIQALLEAGAFLNLREHDGNLKGVGSRRVSGGKSPGDISGNDGNPGQATQNTDDDDENNDDTPPHTRLRPINNLPSGSINLDLD